MKRTEITLKMCIKNNIFLCIVNSEISKKIEFLRNI